MITECDKTYYFDDHYFHKSYNIISKVDQINLIQESESYLKTHRKIGELCPPIMAKNFFTKKTLEKQCWKNLTKKICNEVNEYSKNYLHIIPKFETCWINKVNPYTEQDIENTLYFDNNLQLYTDNHYHSHHKDQVISCIFYLQNPDKKYGTLVRTKNGSLVLDGTINSLTIFDPRSHHTAIYPFSEENLTCPRYVIIMSFTKGSELTPPGLL
jgi:hypothetical protein